MQQIVALHSLKQDGIQVHVVGHCRFLLPFPCKTKNHLELVEGRSLFFLKKKKNKDREINKNEPALGSCMSDRYCCEQETGNSETSSSPPPKKKETRHVRSHH